MIERDGLGATAESNTIRQFARRIVVRPKPLFHAVLLVQVLLLSCAAPVRMATVPISQLPGPTATTTPPTPTASAATIPPPFSGATTKLNIDELMPAAPGREPVLFYCINCHTIAPIVITRWTEIEWTAFVNMFHRARVPVSEAEWDQMLDYLVTNFAPGRPIPPLPPELEDDWTGSWFE